MSTTINGGDNKIMNVRNGCEQKRVTSADFRMVSADPRRIVLPYSGELWGDIYVEAQKLILLQKGYALDFGMWRYDAMVKNLAVEVFFNVQKKVVHTTAYLHIDTMDGDHVDGRILLTMDAAEVKSILDIFFSVGNGVDDEFLSYYADAYATWKGG